MKILYSAKIKKKLENNLTIRKFFGKLADKIIIRISLLKAADNLANIPNIPPTRRHKLIGNYLNCWGIEIEKNWRIIISPTNQDINNIENIKEITIIDIVDYH